MLINQSCKLKGQFKVDGQWCELARVKLSRLYCTLAEPLYLLLLLKLLHEAWWQLSARAHVPVLLLVIITVIIVVLSTSVSTTRLPVPLLLLILLVVMLFVVWTIVPLFHFRRSFITILSLLSVTIFIWLLEHWKLQHIMKIPKTPQHMS